MIYIKIILCIIIVFSYFLAYNKGKIDAINQLKIELNNKQNNDNINIINENKELKKELEIEKKKQEKTIVKIQKDIQYIYKKDECMIEQKDIQSINELLKKEE